jgi:hypothetical protein
MEKIYKNKNKAQSQGLRNSILAVSSEHLSTIDLNNIIFYVDQLEFSSYVLSELGIVQFYFYRPLLGSYALSAIILYICVCVCVCVCVCENVSHMTVYYDLLSPITNCLLPL